MGISTILLIFMLFYPHATYAETFKSAEFLKWKRESQNFYIDANIGMAGLIAAQNDKKHAECLEGWYWDDKVKSIDFILKSMRDFPDYHPRGVILGVLEAQCGKFEYRIN
ncbi:hypothetical protein ABVF61_19085 [Roseibium sp. HPY-6]|uniref:hypothetical protein n=1 Tax=Roseibium sp. HPY-6 TaxID=3229852 RepID=UPI00338FF08E